MQAVWMQLKNLNRFAFSVLAPISLPLIPTGEQNLLPHPPLPTNVFFKIMNRCLRLGGEIPSVTSAKTPFIFKQPRLEPERSSIQAGIKVCLSIRIALLTLRNDLRFICRHSTGMNGNGR
jgi:hypothetical protein